AMPLALVDVVLVHLPGLAERFDHLLGLGARHPRVVRALKDEQRREDLRRVRDRRAIAVPLGVLRRVAELAKQVYAQIAALRLEHRLPSEHAVDGNARVEAVWTPP